jgi:hypothetical protein
MGSTGVDNARAAGESASPGWNDAVESSFNGGWTQMNTEEKDILRKAKPTPKRWVCQGQRNNEYPLRKSVFICVHPWLN